jgi:predicted RNase H-like HicB family nuclease
MAEGWARDGGTKHEKFPPPSLPGIKIMMPRHRGLTPGVARSIASAAGRIRGGMRMSPYIVLIDDEAGAYGGALPDCPGRTATGATIDEAMVNATAALSAWMSDRIAAGSAPPAPRAPEVLRTDPSLAEALTEATPGVVPLLLDSGRPVRVAVSLDAAVPAQIDTAARARGLTRSTRSRPRAESPRRALPLRASSRRSPRPAGCPCRPGPTC